jgi:hypothetical protein
MWQPLNSAPLPAHVGDTHERRGAREKEDGNEDLGEHRELGEGEASLRLWLQLENCNIATPEAHLKWVQAHPPIRILD